MARSKAKNGRMQAPSASRAQGQACQAGAGREMQSKVTRMPAGGGEAACRLLTEAVELQKTESVLSSSVWVEGTLLAVYISPLQKTL